MLKHGVMTASRQNVEAWFNDSASRQNVEAWCNDCIKTEC